MANSADPDQLASSKPTDLDLHCLQRQGISGFSRTRYNFLPCLSYNLNNSISLSGNVSKNCWMNGKQCRPWSDTAFCNLGLDRLLRGANTQGKSRYKVRNWMIILFVHQKLIWGFHWNHIIMILENCEIFLRLSATILHGALKVNALSYQLFLELTSYEAYHSNYL